MKPLFIFSLPRSGSTLLQYLLAAHPQISTVSEPWVLLPFVYSLKEDGVYAEFVHKAMVRAVKDFYCEMPNGKKDYLEELSNLAMNLYSKAAGSKCEYFLDKTPRYHLIIEEIMEIFPEGRFVFLWRNPLAIISSIMSSWAGGRWKLYSTKIDLYKGLSNLIYSYSKNLERCFSINYEELVIDPELEFMKLFEYLELPYDNTILKNYKKVERKGKKGDHSGFNKYDSINNEPLEKWKLTLNNPIRRLWARKYLKWIGKERLSVMGYDLQILTDSLSELPLTMRFVFSDIFRVIGGLGYPFVEPVIMLDKLKLLPDFWKINAHR